MNVGCPAGFGDIGVGEPSRHDSIDKTDYFYEKQKQDFEIYK